MLDQWTGVYHHQERSVSERSCAFQRYSRHHLFTVERWIHLSPHTRDTGWSSKTREVIEEDRSVRLLQGDWIFIIDYPCEFLAHLFTAMDRNDNDDQFIKIQSKSVTTFSLSLWSIRLWIRCTHVRRNLATLNDECYIVIRPAETFRIATEGFDTLAIVREKVSLSWYFILIYF